MTVQTKKDQLIATAVEKTLELGPDPEAMAKTLQAMGFVGTMGDSQYCPMAKFYRKLFPDEYVAVTGETVTIDGCTFGRPEGYTSSSNIVYVPSPAALTLPAQVFDFVADFDECKFPDLVDPTCRGDDEEDDDDFDDGFDDEGDDDDFDDEDDDFNDEDDEDEDDGPEAGGP
jgi:hypothetical protein